MTKEETKKALETLNEVTIKEQGLSFVKLLHQWHKGNSMFASDIERIVCKAMLAHKSQLKPQEVASEKDEWELMDDLSKLSKSIYPPVQKFKP